MAKSNSTNDPVFVTCAVRAGRVMLGREPRQGEDDLVVLGCIDTESARCLADQLSKSADIAEPRPSDQIQTGALKKAEQTVAETADDFGYEDVRKSLRKTAQAMAILRSIWLAIEAQEDGSVRYEDNSISRWGPAVDGACACVHEVRELFMSRVSTPDTVNWWTSLNLIEAMGAALWHTGIGMHKGDFEPGQLQSCADAAIDCLESMYGELTAIADTMGSERESGGAA